MQRSCNGSARADHDRNSRHRCHPQDAAAKISLLLIDRVVDIRSDFSGVGIKNVAINEPQVLGHFTERLIYPGVLMIEGMAQTAGVISLLSTDTDRATAVYFLTIDKCKFYRTAKPGDVLYYHMRVLARRRDM